MSLLPQIGAEIYVSYGVLFKNTSKRRLWPYKGTVTKIQETVNGRLEHHVKFRDGDEDWFDLSEESKVVWRPAGSAELHEAARKQTQYRNMQSVRQPSGSAAPGSMCVTIALLHWPLRDLDRGCLGYASLPSGTPTLPGTIPRSGGRRVAALPGRQASTGMQQQQQQQRQGQKRKQQHHQQQQQEGGQSKKAPAGRRKIMAAAAVQQVAVAGERQAQQHIESVAAEVDALNAEMLAGLERMIEDLHEKNPRGDDRSLSDKLLESWDGRTYYERLMQMVSQEEKDKEEQEGRQAAAAAAVAGQPRQAAKPAKQRQPMAAAAAVRATAGRRSGRCADAAHEILAAALAEKEGLAEQLRQEAEQARQETEVERCARQAAQREVEQLRQEMEQARQEQQKEADAAKAADQRGRQQQAKELADAQAAAAAATAAAADRAAEAEAAVHRWAEAQKSMAAILKAVNSGMKAAASGKEGCKALADALRSAAAGENAAPGTGLGSGRGLRQSGRGRH